MNASQSNWKHEIHAVNPVMALASYQFAGTFEAPSASVTPERRIRILSYDSNGKVVEERVELSPLERETWEFTLKKRIPSGIREIRVLVEARAGGGEWQILQEDSYPVAMWSAERIPWLFRGLISYLNKVRHSVVSRLPKRPKQRHKKKRKRRPTKKTWRKYQKLCREMLPREAWDNELEEVERMDVWSVVRDRPGMLGTFHHHDPKPVKFDEFPATGNGAPLPRLSVVTPSYNQAEFLAGTMESVLQDPDLSVEYIVMDGGSNDGSRELIESYSDRLKHWQSAPDKGQSSAIQEGFLHSEGQPDDVMAYLNSDDIFCPGTLRYVLGYFADHPEVDAVYGHRIVINTEDQEIGRWVLPPHDDDVFKLVDYVPQETLFWRRRLYDKIGGIDPNFQFAMDWDLILRFQNSGARIERLPWFLSMFRVHELQKTQTDIKHVGSEEMTLLRNRENGGEEVSEKTIEAAVRKALVESVWYSDRLREGKRI